MSGHRLTVLHEVPNISLIPANHQGAVMTDHVDPDFDRAGADYRAAIERNQQFWMDYIDPAVGHLDRGEYDRAIAYFDMMIELAPKEAEIYRARGGAYAGRGDYDRAIAEYLEAVRLNPRYHDAYIDLAEAYRQLALACDAPGPG